jgi:hypothetical protein
MHCEKEEKKPDRKINVKNANPSTAHNRAQIPQKNAEKEFKFNPKTRVQTPTKEETCYQTQVHREAFCNKKNF